MFFKVLDIVVLKGDDFKELWEITSISKEYINLKGKTKRSLKVVKVNEIEKADEETIDMKLREKNEYIKYLCNNVNYWGRKDKNRKEEKGSEQIFEVAGTILHLDTDKDYLEQCLKLYKSLNIPAVGFAMEADEMPLKVSHLLKTYKPNILVITGHDLYNTNKNLYDLHSYANSKYYAQTVMKAREYDNDYNALMIFAGACSSYFEVLIMSGANFASSPKRIEIEALDPAVVACHIALTPILSPIDLDTCIKDTISMYEGIGGIQTGGALRYATFKNIRDINNNKNYYSSYNNCINTLGEYEKIASVDAKGICDSLLDVSEKNIKSANETTVKNNIEKECYEEFLCREENLKSISKKKVRKRLTE